MSPLSESNSPAKVTAPQKQSRPFLPKLFGRKNSKTELIATEAVVAKENAEAPPAAKPTAVDVAKQMAERFNPGFQYVKLEFEVLANKLEEFKAALRDRPDGIPFTVQQKGFKMFLPCIHNETNEAGNYTVTFMGMWKSCDDWKAYMATPERAVDSEFMKVAFPTLGPKGLTPTFTDALDLGPEAHVFAEAAGEHFEYVKLEFEVLAEKLEAFQEGLKGPDGIPFTVKQPGFKAFFPCVHHEKNEAGNYTVTFFAMWRTAAEQQAYMSTPQRAPDSAFMAALFPCLGPKGLDIVYAKPLDLGTPHAFYTPSPEIFIRSWLAEYALVAKTSDGEAFDAMWAKYWAPDAVVIRPSGNPMDKSTWKGMVTSDDVSFASSECLSIDSTTLFAGGKAACVTFTTHDKFTYKGTPNDDIAKYSATLELTEEGSWKMIHAHRATGQTPA